MGYRPKKLNELLGDIGSEQRFVDVGPGQAEISLSCHPTDISIVRCEVDGDTVPFSFDSYTGTVDLPEHLRGQTARIYYRYKTRHEADTVVEDIRLQEKVRLGRPLTEHEESRAVVIAQVEGGPYRGGDIIYYEKPKPPLTRWQDRWQRFRFWLGHLVARILGWD